LKISVLVVWSSSAISFDQVTKLYSQLSFLSLPGELKRIPCTARAVFAVYGFRTSGPYCVSWKGKFGSCGKRNRPAVSQSRRRLLRWPSGHGTLTGNPVRWIESYLREELKISVLVVWSSSAISFDQVTQTGGYNNAPDCQKQGPFVRTTTVQRMTRFWNGSAPVKSV
jgi:hypothetical protein